jgi:flagellar basal-body rod protein FlgF
MMTASRAFQSVSSLIESSESSMQNAIRSLGEPIKA